VGDYFHSFFVLRLYPDIFEAYFPAHYPAQQRHGTNRTHPHDSGSLIWHADGRDDGAGSPDEVDSELHHQITLAAQ